MSSHSIPKLISDISQINDNLSLEVRLLNCTDRIHALKTTGCTF